MKKLLLSCLAVCLLSSLSAKKPVCLYLIGDETMADVSMIDGESESAIGWGQVFPTYVTSDLRVENHAVAGASTKSYVEDGHWAVVLDRAKRGSIVLIQLALNDIEPDDAAHYATIDVMEDHLTTMIAEAKKKGLTVVLLTPVSRYFFQSGTFYHRLGGYPEGIRRVAQRYEVPMVDVEKMTAAKWEALGEEGARKMFVEGSDVKLTTEGALTVGGLVARELQELNVKAIAKYLKTANGTIYTQPWKDAE